MKLRTRLLTQETAIILGTVIATIISVLIYGCLFAEFTKKPVKGLVNSSLVAVMTDNKVIHKSDGLSDIAIKEIFMNLEMEKDEYKLNGYNYKVSFDSSGGQFTVLKLTPVIDIAGDYKNLLLFTIISFIISFIIANLIAQSYNKKYITDPILQLKDDMEKLSLGELESAVNCNYDVREISELSEAVENLRLKLKESVYYREKFESDRKFLISGISHDLRTPITAVRGYIEGILDGMANTREKQNEYLKKAINKIDTMRTMIDDLLLYSKLDMNQLAFCISEVSILDYMKQRVADNTMYYEQQKKQIKFHGGISEDINVRIDATRFERVIQNIFDNSMKNISENTGITEVFLRENSASVIIEIKDNGKGIKKEDLPNIFKRFYRGDSARSAAGSSGLGLTIAKQIVEGLGGRIWAVSEEDKGAAILISLKKTERTL